MAYAMLAEAYEAQRVARNYAKAAKRSQAQSEGSSSLATGLPGAKENILAHFF